VDSINGVPPFIFCPNECRTTRFRNVHVGDFCAGLAERFTSCFAKGLHLTLSISIHRRVGAAASLRVSLEREFLSKDNFLFGAANGRFERERKRERERERGGERSLVGTFANDRARTAPAAKALSFAARRLAIILNRIRDPRRSRSRRGEEGGDTCVRYVGTLSQRNRDSYPAETSPFGGDALLLPGADAEGERGIGKCGEGGG